MIPWVNPLRTSLTMPLARPWTTPLVILVSMAVAGVGWWLNRDGSKWAEMGPTGSR
jgi:hypothetical protein